MELGQGVLRDDRVADGVLLAVLDVPDAAVGSADAALHPGLFLQAQERGVRLGRLARASSVTVRCRRAQLLALGRIHPGHEQQVVGGPTCSWQ